MSDIMKFENLQDCIIEIRDQKVLLDVDVAEIYGVETRDINKAVANNPDKFPVGYVVELSKQESGELIASIFDDDLQTTDTETSIELNFAVLKFKHTIKKKKK